MPYRDKSDGTRNTHPYNLYLYSLTLDPSEAVSSITLPNDGNVRVLAMDLIPATSAAGLMSDGGFQTPSVSAGVAGNDSGFTASNLPAPEGMQVGFLQAGGSFSQTVDGVVGTFTPAGTAYQQFATTTFTVTAGTHTVVFQGLDSDGGDNTALLDDNRITPA
jgi:hypothetical protein